MPTGLENESAQVSEPVPPQSSHRQSLTLGTSYHLEDGPEQEARDAAMREVMSIELLDTPSSGEPAQATCANLWADKDKSKLQFSYDAEAVAEEWWNAVGKYEIGSAGVEKHSRRVRVAPVAPTTADQ